MFFCAILRRVKVVCWIPKLKAQLKMKCYFWRAEVLSWECWLVNELRILRLERWWTWWFKDVDADFEFLSSCTKAIVHASLSAILRFLAWRSIWRMSLRDLTLDLSNLKLRSRKEGVLAKSTQLVNLVLTRYYDFLFVFFFYCIINHSCLNISLHHSLIKLTDCLPGKAFYFKATGIGIFGWIWFWGT